MKKIISIILFIALAVCAFSSCRQTTVTLTESQMDEIIFPSGDSSKKVRPSAEAIIGKYSVEGKDENSDHTVWKAHVSNREGKILLQITLPENNPKTITEAIFANVTSEYDPATGRFEQTYVADEYTSIYEAYFSVEGGKIKIDLHNSFFYHNDGVVYSGIKAMGYKD